MSISKHPVCCLLSLIGLLLHCGASLAQTAHAKAASHKIVRVTSPAARRPAEVSVAVHPTNPDRLIAVLNQGRGMGEASGNHAYVSEDGGSTWKGARLPELDQRGHGDDAIAFGPDGTAHRVCIAFNGIRQSRPARAHSGVFANSSKDGMIWSNATPVVDHVNSVEPFEDKPWLAVDTVSDSPHKGNVYVAWTRFDVYGSKDAAHKSHVYFSRSRDGGRSFSAIARISEKAGDCLDSSQTLMGAMPAVGPRGEVYVAWAGPDGIALDQSTDGGATFGADKIIAKTPGGWDIPAAGLGRHNGLPVVGVDLSSGPNRGSIHVCWIDKRHGDPDVFLTSSRDGGATWSEPVRVNDDEKGNGKEQLFAWMAVDPADGSINIIFYDRRDLKDTLTGLTLARSIDGGRTFANHKVNQAPFPCYRGIFFGDYIGIAASQGRVAALYCHFLDQRQLAISAALFRFKPGRQETAETFPTK